MIVLTGAMGSGKSELIRYVTNYIKEHKDHSQCPNHDNCRFKTDLHTIIDFNEYNFSDRSGFNQFIFYKFLNVVNRIFDDDNIICDFINWTIDTYETNYFIGISLFTEAYPNWVTSISKKKITIICNWIRDKYENKSFENGVKALLEMLNFYQKYYPRLNKTCVMFIFDNIDGIDEKEQNIIIDEINRIATTSLSKIILTSRLTTFNYIRGNTSFEFYAFENAGYQPISIILHRLEHYIKNKDYDIDYINIRKSIPKDMLNAFDNRLDFIYEKLTDNQKGYDRLKRSIIALSGLSIRKGLSIFRRLFSNHIINWENSIPKEDMLIRSLYSFDFEKGIMRADDKRLSNIYINPNTLKSSLLPLRLLNVLCDAREKKNIITKNDIIFHLGLFNSKYVKEVDAYIKYMILGRKRLLYISGFGISEYDNLENINAEVNITFAGNQYFEYLSTDLQYIQSCFEIIDWDLEINNNMINESILFIQDTTKSNNSSIKFLIEDLKELKNRSKDRFPHNVNYDNIYERLGYIRACLYSLFLKDIVETIYYKKRLRDVKFDIKNLTTMNELITVRIISIISNTILNILKNHDPQIAINEIRNWYDFIIFVEDWNSSIFYHSKNNPKIISTKKYYESYLTSIDK